MAFILLKIDGRAGAPSKLSAIWIAENVVLSLVPSPVITGMMATAIPAAIRPYSMAVAAFFVFQELDNQAHK